MHLKCVAGTFVLLLGPPKSVGNTSKHPFHCQNQSSKSWYETFFSRPRGTPSPPLPYKETPYLRCPLFCSVPRRCKIMGFFSASTFAGSGGYLLLNSFIPFILLVHCFARRRLWHFVAHTARSLQLYRCSAIIISPALTTGEFSLALDVCHHSLT